MKIHKYEVDLSTGRVMGISGAWSEDRARELAEREIREHPERHGEGTTVVGVRLIRRGVWG